MARPKSNTGDESEYHTVAVRLHVTGAGNLQLSLEDIDRSQVSQLSNIVMVATSGRIAAPTVLANFQSQRTCLEGQTTEINETFRIHKVILFAKPVAIEYPM